MFISRMSRAAAEDSFAAMRLMPRGSVTHGLQPWLSSVTATRLELVSQVCWHLGQGGELAWLCDFMCKAVGMKETSERRNKKSEDEVGGISHKCGECSPR